MIEILLRVRGLKRRLIFNPTTAYSCREDGQAQVSLYHCDSSLQLFIRTHNETLTVAAMRVSNEDYLVRTNPRLETEAATVALAMRCRIKQFDEAEIACCSVRSRRNDLTV